MYIIKVEQTTKERSTAKDCSLDKNRIETPHLICLLHLLVTGSKEPSAIKMNCAVRKLGEMDRKSSEDRRAINA